MKNWHEVVAMAVFIAFLGVSIFDQSAAKSTSSNQAVLEKTKPVNLVKLRPEPTVLAKTKPVNLVKLEPKPVTLEKTKPVNLVKLSSKKPSLVKTSLKGAKPKPREIACLPESVKERLRQVEMLFGPVTIVSSHRPGARIAGTNRPSYHRWCRAVDFTMPNYVAACKWLAKFHEGGVGRYYGYHHHCHIDDGVSGRRWVQYGRKRDKRRATLQENRIHNFGQEKY